MSEAAEQLGGVTALLRGCTTMIRMSEGWEYKHHDAVVMVLEELPRNTLRARLLVACRRETAEVHRLAISLGAAGVIPAHISVADFGALWSAVTAGYYPLPDRFAASTLKDPPGLGSSGSPVLECHELEAVRLLAAGATTSVVAEYWRCSERHARRRMRDLWDRLGVDSKIEAVAALARWGIL